MNLRLKFLIKIYLIQAFDENKNYSESAVYAEKQESLFMKLPQMLNKRIKEKIFLFTVVQITIKTMNFKNKFYLIMRKFFFIFIMFLFSQISSFANERDFKLDQLFKELSLNDSKVAYIAEQKFGLYGALIQQMINLQQLEKVRN